jgi:uridine kinase
MLHDLITVTPQHEKAAKMIFNKLIEIKNETEKDKMIITISGEVGSGKSTISIVLGRLLKDQGVRAKIIDLDDFYKIPPLQRREWRLKHGLKSIGYEEYDWDKVDQNISAFKKCKSAKMPCVDLITRYVDELTTNYNGVDMLIINGLYSLKIKEADLKVLVEHTFEQTRESQLYNKKEKIDDYRLKIMEREHEVVQSLKNHAEFFIDFENSIYHL